MPDNEKDRKEAARAAGEQAAGGGSKLPVLLMLVNSALLAAVLAVLVLRPTSGAPRPPAADPAEDGREKTAKKDDGKKPEKGERAAPGPVVKLPDFVVHLRDPEMDRYARISIEVEVADEKAKEALTSRLPAIRDSFITYLSDRTTADLRGGENIARAKSELAERLRDAAPGAPVRSLFVTELVVQ
jgi:flagellar FliL protein